MFSSIGASKWGYWPMPLLLLLFLGLFLVSPELLRSPDGFHRPPLVFLHDASRSFDNEKAALRHN